eukprot:scaffold128414_cov63-Phaeocystis_antarctica.AAC.2
MVERRVALGWHGAARQRRRVGDEPPAAAHGLGPQWEESSLPQPPALARTVGLDEGEVHHQAVSALDALLYVEDVARADAPRRQRRDAAALACVPDHATIGPRRLDRVDRAGLLVADAPLELDELVEGQLVVHLVAPATVAVYLRHPVAPLLGKVDRGRGGAEDEDARVEPRRPARPWVVAATRLGVCSLRTVVVAQHVQAVGTRHHVGLW